MPFSVAQFVAQFVCQFVSRLCGLQSGIAKYRTVWPDSVSHCAPFFCLNFVSRFCLPACLNKFQVCLTLWDRIRLIAQFSFASFIFDCVWHVCQRSLCVCCLSLHTRIFRPAHRDCAHQKWLNFLRPPYDPGREFTATFCLVLLCPLPFWFRLPTRPAVSKCAGCERETGLPEDNIANMGANSSSMAWWPVCFPSNDAPISAEISQHCCIVFPGNVLTSNVWFTDVNVCAFKIVSWAFFGRWRHMKTALRKVRQKQEQNQSRKESKNKGKRNGCKNGRPAV